MICPFDLIQTKPLHRCISRYQLLIYFDHQINLELEIFKLSDSE